jgi:dTDP-4-amino-4,6-dideoxygalactose transaminase
MIFTDDADANKWFRLARYEGRSEVSLMEDKFEMLGWNMYMTPEQAARGLVLASYLKESNVVYPTYPDLSLFDIYRST